MSNAIKLRKHFKENNIIFQESQFQDGTKFILRFEFEYSNVIEFTLGIYDDNIRNTMIVFNIAKYTNKFKEVDVLRHINNLNKNYRHTKFYINDDQQCVGASLDYDVQAGAEFDPNHFMFMFNIFANTLKDEFEGLMKLIWS